jgi:hypothetical protein
VVTGDELGEVYFAGYDSANFLKMAAIKAVSTGTIAATRVPTYLSFSVATDAAPSVLTELLQIQIGGLSLTGGKYIKPSADSTSALVITKTNGSTAVLTFDTTNSRAAHSGQVTIAGVEDIAQLQVTGNATQTSVLQSWRNSTPTIVASVSNLGHAAFGQSGAPSANTVMSVSKSFIDPAATTIGGDSSVAFSFTGTNAQVLEGMRGLATITQTGGNATAALAARGVQATVTINGTTNTVTGGAGLVSIVQNTAAGTLTSGYGVYIQSAVNNGGGTLSNAYGLFVDNQTVGANLQNWAIFTNTGRVSVLGSDTIASAAGATWKGIEFRAATATITGSTNITTATGFNYIDIAQPTLSAASALTVTNAATLYIANAPAPAGAGPATITNAYALWVDNGAVRFDGNMGFFATAPAAQQTSGANLTNNVTSGGVNDTIADFTSLTVYATDAAAIRNDIYQLARKLKQINDGLRTYGLFT